jgi:nitrate/nitrite transporter NarK
MVCWSLAMIGWWVILLPVAIVVMVFANRLPDRRSEGEAGGPSPPPS